MSSLQLAQAISSGMSEIQAAIIQHLYERTCSQKTQVFCLGKATLDKSVGYPDN